MRDVEADVGAQPIRTGTVLLGVERFTIDNESPTYRGVVQVEDDAVVSIIKDLPPKELANELLAAVIALAAGLPIPPPILALCPAETGIGVACPLTDGSGGLVFASANVGGVSVRQFYMAAPNRSTEALIGERLGAWTEAGRLYGFDSWIANTDRNAGNLLFGGAGGIWLIDHARGFTGPAWSEGELDPLADYGNKLAAWLTPLLSADDRVELARDVGDASDGLDRLALDRLADASHIAALLTTGDQDAVIAFLAARITHVPRLASRALGLLA